MSQEYREYHRKNEIPKYYNGYLHFGSAILILMSAVVLSSLKLQNVSVKEFMTVPLTLLLGTLIEYGLHRYPLHNPMPGAGIAFKTHALQHHKFFTEENPTFENSRDFHMVFFPWWAPIVAVIIFSGVHALLLTPLLSQNVGLLFIITGSLNYLFYEVMHCSHHTPRKKFEINGWWGFMRKIHSSHHNPANMNRYNFGVTAPIADWLFGTLKK